MITFAAETFTAAISSFTQLYLWATELQTTLFSAHRWIFCQVSSETISSQRCPVNRYI